MKPSCVVFLLILSLILTETQGIRLRKESLAVDQQKQHDEESTLLKKSNTGAEEAILCKDEQLCTGSIKNRKLVTTSVSTTKSLSENVKNSEDHVTQPNVDGEAKEVKVKPLTTSNNFKDLPHEDPVEITEMDYSPARRKPPIHN